MKNRFSLIILFVSACAVKPDRGNTNATTGGSSSGGGTTAGTTGGSTGSTQNASAKALQFPAIAPLIEASLPASFGGSGVGRDLSPARDDLAAAIISRFFSAGPTDVLSIAAGLDGVTGNIDTTLGQTPAPACASQAAVPYTMNIVGAPEDFVALCYTGDGETNLTQIGVDSAGVHYLYQIGGVGRQAVILTPLATTDGSSQYAIEAWLTVGENNASGCPNADASTDNWDTCSYTLMHLTTNTQSKVTEFAVAGLGVGFCGAQLMTDGNSAWLIGSEDGPGCAAVTSACVWVGSGSSTADCTALQDFQLTPLGRQGGVAESAQALAETGGSPGDWAASQYPDTADVLLDGTSDDALHFGPPASQPTSGVGNLSP